MTKGFAFVNYATFEASDAAIRAMDGQYLCNRPISVKYALKKVSTVIVECASDNAPSFPQLYFCAFVVNEFFFPLGLDHRKTRICSGAASRCAEAAVQDRCRAPHGQPRRETNFG